MRTPTILAAACLLLASCKKEGCTDPAASNFNAAATIDDGSCDYLGCTDSDAWNFDATATIDDGSCEFPTLDGYTYKVVQIGEQVWFAENLRTTVYANGDHIWSLLTDEEWISTTAGAMAVYGEGDSDCGHLSPDIDACDEEQSLEAYGRLYKWYAVDDERGLCPTGWHVPTDGEWTELEDYITSQGFAGTEGTALKSTAGWYTWYNNNHGTDDFGFSALPGGTRNDDNGSFSGAGNFGRWWSSSPNGSGAWSRDLSSYTSGIGRDITDPRDGFSVRCLQDAE